MINRKLVFILSFFSIFQLSQVLADSCHMLCQCNGSTCLSCFEGFDISSNGTPPSNGTCSCPKGFYSKNNACLFCSDGCDSCLSSTDCVECFEGYTKENGSCKLVRYDPTNSWVSYLVGEDFKTLANGSKSTFGMSFHDSENSSSYEFENCDRVDPEKFLIVESLDGEENETLEVSRVYSGLPYHEWVRLTIKYVVLDEWENDNITLKDIWSGEILSTKEYSNENRSLDLCGDDDPDSVDRIVATFSHTKSVFTLGIAIEAETKLAIKSIFLQVGTCPRNCLSCSNPKNCLVCNGEQYLLDQGICKCHPQKGIVTSFGCIRQCQAGYVYVGGIEKCTLCSLYLPNCFNCQFVNQTYQCLDCNVGLFKNGDICDRECPLGTYAYSKSQNKSLLHCTPCSENCSKCYSESCSICKTNFYLLNGTCQAKCNPPSIIVGEICQSNNCSEGCLSCNTSISTCYVCYPGRWLYNGTCRIECPYNYFRWNSSCLACSENCTTCFNSEVCLKCSVNFTLRNGDCRPSTSCQSSYYLDYRVNNCIACPNYCLTCFKSLCYSCLSDYRLDNGKCVLECSGSKHRVEFSDENKICYWNDPLCEVSHTNKSKECERCKYLPYFLAKTQLGECTTQCPSGETFSFETQFPPVFSNKSCQQSCSVYNCDVCINQIYCFKCKAGYVYSAAENFCLDECGDGFVSDTFQCIPCPDKCEKCDISGNCIKKSDNFTANSTCSDQYCEACTAERCIKCKSNSSFYLNLYEDSYQGCIMNCPAETFPDTLSMQCRKCQSECKKCSSISVCTTCKNGFYLHQASCLQKCPSGTFPNSELQICENCAANCKTCFGPKEYECLSCYLNNKLDYNECVSNCPINKYQDSFRHCDWCHESCKYCYGPADFQCLECKGYDNYLYRGECFRYNCPAATYLAIPATRECFDCVWGCAYCDSKEKCTSCYGGFYLVNGQCLTSCPTSTYYKNGTCLSCNVSNCSSCDEFTCYSCKNNYALFNNSCASSCPNGTFLLQYQSSIQCIKCSYKCLNCQSQYDCKICETGTFLANGQCKTNCGIKKYFNSTLNECVNCSNDCLECNSEGCLKCSSGFFYSEGLCKMNCSTGYYVSVSSFSCEKCAAFCTACTSYFSCKTCENSYTLVNGFCIKQQDCNLNCQSCGNNNTCFVCKTGYFLYINGTTSICYGTCPNGTYIYGDGSCRNCDTGCSSCSAEYNCLSCKLGFILLYGQCIQNCPIGYYASTSSSKTTCELCNSECKSCRNSSYCEACVSSTAFIENGVCKERNTCNTASSFYSPVVGYCLPCISNCKICESTTKCQVCLNGFYLTENQTCISSCHVGSYLVDTNCVTCPFPCNLCTSALSCSSCFPGFPFNPRTLTCELNCSSIGTFINLQTNQCDLCSIQCLSCFGNATTCLECSTGYFLFGSQCVTSCPYGTYEEGLLRKCLPCSSNCQECGFAGNCSICSGNKILFEGICLEKCPKGFYASNGQCTACMLPCRECYGGSNYECTSCILPFFYFQGRCLSSCPPNYFINIENGHCRKCAENCSLCTSFENCTLCKDGFNLNTTTKSCGVIENCNANLVYCKNCIDGKCVNCFNGFYLYDGNCISTCKEGYWGNIGTGLCEPCGVDCKNCSHNSECITCLDSYSVFNGKCYQVCPEGTVSITESSKRICKPDSCTHYIQNNCVHCLSPYYLHNQTCLEKCPNGTFVSELECKNCSVGCLICRSLSECNGCIDGYKLMNGRCVENCSTGYYGVSNETNGYFCTVCPRYCLSCNSSGGCTSCRSGTYLNINGLCETFCLAPFFADSLTGSCKNCSLNCQECLSEDKCITCINDKYLIMGQCVSVCPLGYYGENKSCLPCLNNCRKCNALGACEECLNGYKFNRVTNKCEKECSIGSYLSLNQECLPCNSRCFNCIGDDLCLTCNSSYVLFDGKCLETCPSSYYAINGKCEKCNVKCKECTGYSDNCTECQSGYNLSQGYCVSYCPSHTYYLAGAQCQPCSNSSYNICSICYGPMINQCLECYSPYVMLNGACLNSCPSGYTAKNGVCLPCNQTGCLVCGSGKCERCIWGYFVFEGNCINECPSNYYPIMNITSFTCQQCSYPCEKCISSTICTSCLNGFFLYQANCFSNCSFLSTYPNNATKTCDPCPSNCLSCNISGCITCIDPFKMYRSQCVNLCPLGTYADNNKQCVDCNINNCLQCLPNNACIICSPGFGYLLNGTCVLKCPELTKEINGVCIPIDNQTCTNASNVILNGECLEYCPQGYYRDGTECKKCQNGCNMCISETECTVCRDGYVMNGKTCVLTCPSGYVKIGEICSTCKEPCKTCSISKIECTSCVNSFYLFNGECLENCPASYFPSSSSPFTCTPCHPRCKTCISFEECLECYNPNPLLQAPSCQSNCSSNQQLSLTSDICVNCSVTCETCRANSIYDCITCRDGLKLINGQCRESCPLGYFVNVNNSCAACGDKCEICFSASICTECSYPYVRYNNTCIESCQLLFTTTQGYVASYNNTCQSCPTNCLICQFNLTCLECSNEFVFENGQCKNLCSLDYYLINRKCEACANDCLSCANTKDYCTGCKNNKLLNNGKCVEQCPDLSFTNTTSGECIPCRSPLCSSCQMSPDNCSTCYPPFKSNCQECLTSYVLIFSQCLPCSSNCLTCVITPTNCTSCTLDKVLLDGCLDECPTGYFKFKNEIGYKCLNCPSECEICSDSYGNGTSKCDTCQTGWFKNLNGICVNDCGDGMYEFDGVCVECLNGCKKCDSRDSCDECEIGYYYDGICVNNCPANTVSTIIDGKNVCGECPSGCVKCNSTSNCVICRSDYLLKNGACEEKESCEVGKYLDINGTCMSCSPECSECLSYNICILCKAPKYLNLWQCSDSCPDGKFPQNKTVNGVVNRTCEECLSPCLTCNRVDCLSCVNGTFLKEKSCVQDCGQGYYAYNNTCQKCEQSNCLNCSDSLNCTACKSSDYLLEENSCIPVKCGNCSVCENEKCKICEEGFYLIAENGVCSEICPDGTYGENETGLCEPCMEFCIKCPNREYCEECIPEYSFTANACLDIGWIIYGGLSNMSGFTSNITEITAATYLGTSIGPMVFGEMTSTYFNIEFCQFILFHGAASGDNKEMATFLNSLQSMSLTVPKSESQTSGRLLAANLADPMTFLATNAPIFGLMGGFLLVYILVKVFLAYHEKDDEGVFQTCPNFRFYLVESFKFMQMRFKWIYFDFVAWISFLPFTYFALVQLKNFSFSSALSAISSLLALLIIAVYPLYPFFIAYLLRKNYNSLVQQTDSLIEMSLEPYVYKLKRPETEIPEEGQPILKYFTFENFRLIYVPLKYLRKFIFVLIVAICPVPETSLILLIVLNIIFIAYMAVFRPRVNPYLIFDFIIEGILIIFEVFMLIYLMSGSARTSAFTIGSQAVGFIAANISIIVAIILNLIAYYKIFMCFYELYKHLKKAQNEKEKVKEEGEFEYPDGESLSNENFKEEFLDKKEKEGLKVHIDDDAYTEQNESGDLAMIRDKELYGDSSIIDSNIRKGSSGMPGLKDSMKKRKREEKKEEKKEENTDTIFIDKELNVEIDEEEDDDKDTVMNHNSGIGSNLVKYNKEIYDKEDEERDLGDIPNLKQRSSKKSPIKAKAKPIYKDNSDIEEESFGVKSTLSGDNLIEGGEKKEVNNKYKREKQGEEKIVSGGKLVEIQKGDKFKRKEQSLINMKDQEVKQANFFDHQNQNYPKNDRQSQELNYLDTNKKRKDGPIEKMGKDFEEFEEGFLNEQEKRKKLTNLDKEFEESEELDEVNLRENKKESRNDMEVGVSSDRAANKLKELEQGNMKNQEKSARDVSYEERDSEFIEEGNMWDKYRTNNRKDVLEEENINDGEIMHGNLTDKKLNKRDNKNGGFEKHENKQTEIQQIDMHHRSNSKNKHQQKTNKLDQSQEKVEDGELFNQEKKSLKKIGDDFDQFLEEDNKEIEEMKMKSRELKSKRKMKDDSEADGEKCIEGGEMVERKPNKFKRPSNKVVHEPQNEKVEEVDRKRASPKKINEREQESNEFDEEQKYERIRKNNKDNMFEPNQIQKDKMMNSLRVGDDFEGEDYEKRPASKIERPTSGRGKLSIHESQDFAELNSARRQRNSAIFNNRKKQQGNLEMSENSEYSGDESVGSRTSQKEKKERRGKTKSGVLRMRKRKDENEDDIDELQL